MSRHDDTVSLRQVLDHAHEAMEMARSRSRKNLDEDRMFSLAMTRLLEIIGEAAGRVAPATRGRIPDVPWEDVVGMRNRIIHGYDVVDLNIVWDVVQLDLPPLATAIEAYLRSTTADGELG